MIKLDEDYNKILKELKYLYYHDINKFYKETRRVLKYRKEDFYQVLDIIEKNIDKDNNLKLSKKYRFFPELLKLGLSTYPYLNEELNDYPKSKLYFNRYFIDNKDSILDLVDNWDNFLCNINSFYSLNNYLNKADIVKFIEKDGISDLIKHHCLKLFDYDVATAIGKKNYSRSQLVNLLNSNKYELLTLLKTSLEINDYDMFYNIFISLDDKEQMEWIIDNLDLYNDSIDYSSIVLKGIKKSGYELFKDKIDYSNYSFTEEDLFYICEHDNSFTKEQLINIFKNVNLIDIYRNSFLLTEIINLEIDELTDYFLSDENIEYIRENNYLDKVFLAIKGVPKNDELWKKIITEDNLKVISKGILDDYNEQMLLNGNYEYYYGNKTYFWFVNSKINDKDLNFEVLDFFLKDDNFVAFELFRKRVNKNILREYYESRKDLIDKVINTSSSSELYRIFTNLSDLELKKELTPDRKNLIYHISDDYRIRNYHARCSKIVIDEDKLDKNRFVSSLYYLKSHIIDYELRELDILLEEPLSDELKDDIRRFHKIKSNTLIRFNEDLYSYPEFASTIYLSSYQEFLNEKEISFLRDIDELIRGKDYLKSLELFDKYQDIDIGKRKNEILDKIEDKANESIISSLTDLPMDKLVKEKYIINKKQKYLKVITLDGEPFNFLVRRTSSDSVQKDEHTYCYSTICDKNRSMHYGDTGIKLGYSHIKPKNITFMYPFDGISNNFKNSKYHLKGLKIPRWLSGNDMNKKTLANSSYNELRILGKQKEDFILTYDEANEETLKYAYDHKIPLVKVLRKSYPNSIEDNRDPYANWK